MAVPEPHGRTATQLRRQPVPPARWGHRLTAWRSLPGTSIFLAVLMAGSVVALLSYVFLGYRSLLHSDSAVIVMLAREILRTGHFFPPHWNYANDLMILFPHMLLLPVLPLVGDLRTARAIAVLETVAIFVWTLRYFLRKGGFGTQEFLLTGAVLLSGCSSFIAEYELGQAAYLSLSIVTLLTVALAYAIYETGRETASRQTLYRAVAALTLLIGASVAAGPRVVLALVVPVLAALPIYALLETFWRRESPPGWRGLLAITGSLAGGTVVGVATFLHLCSITHLRAETIAAYASFDGILKNIQVLAQGFLTIGDALPDPGARPLSLYGLITAYRCVMFLAMTLLPGVVLLCYRSIRSGLLRFSALFYFLLSAVTLYYYIFGTVAVNATTARYFIIPLLLGIIVDIMLLFEAAEAGGRWVVAAGIVLLAPLILSSWYDLGRTAWTTALAPDGRRVVVRTVNPWQGIADLLRNNGLDYGYASYWQSEVVSVVSNGAVQVNPVLVGSPWIRPYRHLSSDDWYRPEFHRGRSFLLLTADEAKEVSQDFLAMYLGRPQRAIVTPSFTVLVYANNIAGRLPFWSEQPPLHAALPQQDCRGTVTGLPPQTEDHGAKWGVLHVRLKNLGHAVFSSEGEHPILIGAHLYGAAGKRLLNFDWFQAPLPRAVTPGEETEALVPFSVPPAGDYIVQLDLLQGGVRWFGTPTELPLHVR